MNFQNPLIYYTPHSNFNKQVISERSRLDTQLAQVFSPLSSLSSLRTISPSAEQGGHRDPGLIRGCFTWGFFCCLEKVINQKFPPFVLFFPGSWKFFLLKLVSEKHQKKTKGRKAILKQRAKGYVFKKSLSKTSQSTLPKVILCNWSNLSKACSSFGFRSGLFTMVLAPHLKEGLLLPPWALPCPLLGPEALPWGCTSWNKGWGVYPSVFIPNSCSYGALYPHGFEPHRAWTCNCISSELSKM